MFVHNIIENEKIFLNQSRCFSFWRNQPVIQVFRFFETKNYKYQRFFIFLENDVSDLVSQRKKLISVQLENWVLNEVKGSYQKNWLECLVTEIKWFVNNGRVIRNEAGG